MQNKSNTNTHTTALPPESQFLLDHLKQTMAEVMRIEDPAYRSDPSDTDPILVIGVHPGNTPQLLFEEECEDLLPCFGEDETIQELPALHVLMSYDQQDVMTVGDTRFLFGPALFYNVDREGELISLSLDDLRQVKQLVQELTLPVTFSDRQTFALLLD